MERETDKLKLNKDPYTISKCIKIDIEDDLEKDQNDKNASNHNMNDNENDEYSMLKSFLPKILMNNHNNKENALNKEQIKEDSLRSLKERLVQRLNVITRRLHSEIEKLEKVKTEYENWQNNEIDHGGDLNTSYNEDRQILNDEKEAQFKAFKKESEFKIKVIKQRLARHEQLSILKMNQLSDLLDSK